MNPSASLSPAVDYMKYGTAIMAGLCTFVCYIVWQDYVQTLIHFEICSLVIPVTETDSSFCQAVIQHKK